MPKLPQRKPKRLKGYDYAQDGAYFVTICTKDRAMIFGNMDLIVSCKGGKGELLTLTERMTQQETIIRLPDKSQRAVKRALDRLERRFGRKFGTITTD